MTGFGKCVLALAVSVLLCADVLAGGVASRAWLIVKSAGTGAWSRQGADAGMSKYTASDLSATSPTLAYKKRFFSSWAGYTGNYFFGNNVVIQNGQAVIFSNDVQGTTLQVTVFDWATGATLRKFPQPYLSGEHDREVDSHHFTNPLIWHSDGKIYNRRGGDNRDQYALDPVTSAWHQIGIYAPPDSAAWGGDATAYLQTYGNQLIYRWGHTNDSASYSANNIVDGTYQQMLGPFTAGDSGRYGDWPKVAKSVSVLAANLNNNQVLLEAVNITNGKKLWQKKWASDSGGVRTNASVSDYWRFVATEDGYFAFFTRSGSPTVRVVDLQNGAEKWTRTLTNANERPLLAAHGGALHIIGREQQFKLNIDSGAVIWQTTNSFPGDTGYVHKNYEDANNLSNDPIYRPVVLTDSTVWFVDGATPNTGRLVGLNTASGGIVATVDLAAQARTGTQSLDLVNDLVAADGLLGVLVTVHDSADGHVPQNPYQDLYVYRLGTAPAPPENPAPQPPPSSATPPSTRPRQPAPCATPEPNASMGVGACFNTNGMMSPADGADTAPNGFAFAPIAGSISSTTTPTTVIAANGMMRLTLGMLEFVTASATAVLIRLIAGTGQSCNGGSYELASDSTVPRTVPWRFGQRTLKPGEGLCIQTSSPATVSITGTYRWDY